jgi:predicted heme/steroid binding protein
MKRYESGDALAKDMGIPASLLRKTFDDYTAIGKAQKDPFGKKFFHNSDFRMDDVFHVAIMTPVLHYTMGGLEIDAESRVLADGGKPIQGLFAAGEVAGGVHGANRLGGSSLLGCVVFGRVAGDSAAAYLLQTGVGSAEKAKGRLGAVQGHLAPLSTTITINPEQSSVNLSFSWAGSSSSSSAPSSSSSGSPPSSLPTPSSSSSPSSSSPASASATEEQTTSAGSSSNSPTSSAPEPSSGEYTAADVAKHNKKDDCWVIIDGQVLDVTSFLPGHPGGEKAILLYAGRDATEEFNMLHDPKVS